LSAGRYDIVIEQGAGFRLALTWKDSAGNPVNLTGYTAKAQVRASHKAPVALLGFSVTLGGKAGTVVLQADHEDTEGLLRGGVWDLKLTPPGQEPVRLLEGRAVLKEATTK
jgi:hypothetical protein